MSLWVQEPEGESRGQIRAVLVGIGDYAPGSGLERLFGPARDVEAFRTMLVQRFKVQPGNILALVDEDATVRNILTGIVEHLVHGCEPDDEAVLFFSGHGSRRRDESGADDDGYDDTLVAWDSWLDGKGEISDDMLYSLLSKLSEERVPVSVFVDSCHSGGVFRGGRPRSPDTESALAWSEWPDDFVFYDDHEGGPMLGSHVYAAACRAGQHANEVSVPAGTEGESEAFYGAFSLALVRALAESDPTDTFRGVLRHATALLGAMPGTQGQTPWFRGSGLDREVFGKAERPSMLAMGRVPVRRLGQDYVVLEGGWIHGLRAGAKVELADQDGLVVGSGRVLEQWFGLLEARVGWERNASLPVSGRLVDLPDAVAPIGVVADDLEPDLSAIWSSVSPWVRRCAVTDPACRYKMTSTDGRTVELQDVDGLCVRRVDLSGQASVDRERIMVMLRRAVLFDGLWRVGPASASSDRPGLRFVEPTGLRAGEFDAGIERRGGRWHVRAPTEADSRGTGRWAKGELEVTNRCTRPCVPHVLCLDAAYGITLIAPYWPSARPEQLYRLAPGESARYRFAVYTHDAARYPSSQPLRERFVVLMLPDAVDLIEFERVLNVPPRTLAGGGEQASKVRTPLVPRGTPAFAIRSTDERLGVSASIDLLLERVPSVDEGRRSIR